MPKRLTPEQVGSRRAKLQSLLARAMEDQRIGKKGADERVGVHGRALSALNLKYGKTK